MDKGVFGRKDRLIKQKRHDAYESNTKFSGPTRCVKCGSLFINGRWTWKPAPPVAGEVICPACRRIADRLPAGMIDLRGEFYMQHQEEIINLVRNIEKHEMDAHPMERIMSITQEGNRAQVTTTGIHIARRIGEALGRAFKGELEIQYADGDKTIRISWER